MTNRRIPCAIFVIALGCRLFPLAISQWSKNRRPPAPPFRFPTAELAALDRDLQARFAVVPDKDFGMGRIGPLHELYVPISSQEEATISVLKKRQLQAAFFVMSRRVWRKDQGGVRTAPLQGPVYLTPPPRGFRGRALEEKTVVHANNGIFTAQKIIPFVNPEGTPIPAPPAPADLPSQKELLALGSQVFDTADQSSSSSPVGQTQTLGGGDWRVVAVTVRATDQKCANCHNAMQPQREVVEVGDALGVAFYAYRQIPKSK